MEAAAAGLAAKVWRKAKKSEVEEIDRIGLLPDDILREFISLLPTDEAARTAILARRWRHLWRSAPLSLDDRCIPVQGCDRVATISKILSEHRAAARRLSLCESLCRRLRNSFVHVTLPELDGWLKFHALDNLREMELIFGCNTEPLPVVPLLRFAPTLQAAKFGGCRLTLAAVPALGFPCLKQLIIECSAVSDDDLHGLLSGCPALEILLLSWCEGFGRVLINSPSLKSFGIGSGTDEVIIKDAPRLERLVIFNSHYFRTPFIQIIRAPRLEVLGSLEDDIANLKLGRSVPRGMVADSKTTLMYSVKVLVLKSVGPDLGAVINILKCFPSVEKLYITALSGMQNTNVHSPLGSIECLDLHLKQVVLKGYDGQQPYVNFAKFFVLNARVLEAMKLGIPVSMRSSKICKADQARLLKLDSKASQNARLEFTSYDCDVDFPCYMYADLLSMADPIHHSYCSECEHIDAQV